MWAQAFILAQSPQQAVSRAFLLLVVLLIVGVLVVLGVVLAGYAHNIRQNTDRPDRKDRFAGIDPWEESARRAGPERDELDDEDWEADTDDEHR